MNICKNVTSCAALAMLAVSPVIAQPSLLSTFEGETADGNIAFLFQIVSDNLISSYSVELAFFHATINEPLAFGGAVPTDSFSQAMAAASVDDTYTIEEDTYYFDDTLVVSNPGNNPFTGTETNGFVQTPTTLFISFGTATGNGSPIDVLRIVTPDDDICFSGIIAQGGVNYEVSGRSALSGPDCEIPEPTTAALLGLGGLLVTARKRSHEKAPPAN